MRKCRDIRKRMADVLYDEIDSANQADFFAHLDVCENCRTEFEELSRTLNIMKTRAVQPPEGSYWAKFTEDTISRLEAEEARPARSHLHTKGKSGNRVRVKQWFDFISVSNGNWFPKLAGAVAILLLGIFIGKILFTTGRQPQQVASGSATAKSNIQLVNRTYDYLDKSKLLLLSFANFDSQTDEAAGIDLSRQKEVSAKLVRESQYLKDNLDQPQYKQLRDLVDQLEVILMQIANLEAEHGLPAIDIIKSGVDQSGLLFKINIQEMRKAHRNSAQPFKNNKNLQPKSKES
jgi:hypothetical protein